MSVLYEVSYVFYPQLLIPLCLCAVCLLALVDFVRKPEKRCKAAVKASALICASCFVLILVVNAIIIPDQIGMYDSTIGAYRRGEYMTVEGYVEMFHPMSANGHDSESFSIGNIRFSYNDYSVSQGYHRARSRGGVITGDGQHLRIRYTNYKWLGNVILYIEEVQ
ncbi:MAG: hypothetical protein IKP40_07005 [Clostridia bacterium]|nr:hypothetical protein [Clostridia bacterium]